MNQCMLMPAAEIEGMMNWCTLMPAAGITDWDD